MAASDFTENKHPRYKKGDERGGQFAPKGGDDALDLNDLEGAIYDQQVAMGDSVAKAMGFPQDKVFYSPEINRFEVNGTAYKKAGEAYVFESTHHKYQKGDIVLYPNAISHSTNIGAVMAHEIGHQRYQQLLDSHPSSRLFSPATQAQLAVDDGVTQYSRNWWAAAEQGKASTSLAMHETFAEITMLKATGSAKYNTDVKPSWKKFYEEATLLVKPKGADA